MDLKPLLTLLLLWLTGSGCAASGQVRTLQDEVLRLERTVQETERTVIAARAEATQLDGDLGRALTSLSEKLRARIPGDEQLYAEIQLSVLKEELGALLGRLQGEGRYAGQPYHYTLSAVTPRSHRDRFFITATYRVTLGSDACSGPTNGYLIHQDRELMKLQDLKISCKTSIGELELTLGDQLPLIPLPFSVLRRADLQPGLMAQPTIRQLEIITPLQANLQPDKMVFSARAISLRGGVQ